MDHDPTHDDIRAFLRRLHTALSARNVTLVGITTDGSALYPAPLAELFSGVPHPICTFPVLAEVVKAVLGAVASERKSLAAKQPQLPKGRPSTPAAKQAARIKKRLAEQRAALFTSRYLFVQRHLNIYGPARAVKGSREAQHVSGQMQSSIRPLGEGIISLRALMKSALPFLNKTSTSRAVSSFRVWGSWSDRLCHQHDYTSHRAGGFLYRLVSTPAPVRGFSSR